MFSKFSYDITLVVWVFNKCCRTAG